MSLTRRRFIETASMSFLASAALPAAFAQRNTAAENMTFSPERLTVFNGVSIKTFDRMIGEKFAISDNGRSLGFLTLLSVTADTSTPPAPTTALRSATIAGPRPKFAPQAANSFSVRFAGLGAPLEQGTYTLQNAGVGTFSLFIVPCGPGATTTTYTAVFNLLSKSAIL